MSNELLRTVLIIAFSSAGAIIFMLALLFRISGRFVRDDDPGVLKLTSLGPFISGREDVDGGHYEYSGFTVLGRAWITRRDHGVGLLLKHGYPKEVAERRDGEVAAKMVIRRDGSDTLEVEFTPLRVDFTHRPPRVTGITELSAQSRSYRRAED